MACCRVATTDAVGLQTKGLTQAELDQIVFSNKLGKEKGHESFWSEISRSSWVPPRGKLADQVD